MKKNFPAGVVAVLLGASSVVFADEKNSYIGLGTGSFSPDNSAYDSALGWRIFGGSVISRHFSLQAGYVDFGEMDGPLNTMGETISISTTGIELSTIGRYSFPG